MIIAIKITGERIMQNSNSRIPAATISKNPPIPRTITAIIAAKTNIVVITVIIFRNKVSFYCSSILNYLSAPCSALEVF